MDGGQKPAEAGKDWPYGGEISTGARRHQGGHRTGGTRRNCFLASPRDGDSSIGNAGNGSGGGYGGGIYCNFCTLNMTNTTLRLNRTGDGGIGCFGAGGFWSSATVTVSDSRIQDNQTGLRGDGRAKSGTGTEGIDGYRGGDSLDCIFTPQTHDLVGTMVSPLDPNLAVLSDYGGLTYTHALLAGSPAIDQIPNGVNGCVSGTTEDQRGVIRYAPCDMGAFEGVWYYIFLPLVLR
jgi:hypothetical protein